MIVDRTADILVIIVGYRNSADVRECLEALSNLAEGASFDIFICENGGRDAYQQLLTDLTRSDAPCRAIAGEPSIEDVGSSRFVEIRCLHLIKGQARVWIGCASDNLGYAGGINAWLEPLLKVSAWKGAWILNPDTKPEPQALAALVDRAESGGKAMVGSTILEAGSRDKIRFRGGLHWRKFATRCIALGLGDVVGATHDLSAIEAAMDCPSGASLYATRACIEKIGLMDERYFLFLEDLDWGIRAKGLGLGYAATSVIVHSRGTTTGSARGLAEIPRLTVYLEHRNAIHFVRKHFPWAILLRIGISSLYAVRFSIHGAPQNGLAVVNGVLAGLRGEIGCPDWYRKAATSFGGAANKKGVLGTSRS